MFVKARLSSFYCLCTAANIFGRMSVSARIGREEIDFEFVAEQ
jgi:hypothetical protein